MGAGDLPVPVPGQGGGVPTDQAAQQLSRHPRTSHRDDLLSHGIPVGRNPLQARRHAPIIAQGEGKRDTTVAQSPLVTSSRRANRYGRLVELSSVLVYCRI